MTMMTAGEQRNASATYELWRRWRGCTRKQYFPSQLVAGNWVVLLVLRWGDHMADLLPYDCPYCDGWHVGHPRRSP